MPKQIKAWTPKPDQLNGKGGSDLDEIMRDLQRTSTVKDQERVARPLDEELCQTVGCYGWQ